MQALGSNENVWRARPGEGVVQIGQLRRIEGPVVEGALQRRSDRIGDRRGMQVAGHDDQLTVARAVLQRGKFHDRKPLGDDVRNLFYDGRSARLPGAAFPATPIYSVQMSSPLFADRAATPHTASRRRTQALRWGAVLAVVLTLHWIAAQWIGHNRTAFAPTDTGRVPVQVALLTPERIERAPAKAASARKAVSPAPRAHVLTATRPGMEPPVAAAEGGRCSERPRCVRWRSRLPAPRAMRRARAPIQRARRAGCPVLIPPSVDLKFDAFYTACATSPAPSAGPATAIPTT